MPKRTAEEKLELYKKKIRKLEKKCKSKENRFQRIRYPIDSSEDEVLADTDNPEPQECQDEPLIAAPQEDPMESSLAPRDNNISDCVPASPPSTQDVSVDPELLSALGASTSSTPDFGDDVHESLVSLWSPLLKKGLPKDEKDRLMKEHLIPGNCKLLQAPKLNAEISAAVSDIVRGRDKKLTGLQQQLGHSTAAINKAMDTLLRSENKALALRHLSDGCRLLSDIHYWLTKDRIKLITPSLEKNFLHIIQDSERDETLYGTSLSEKIKASKAIEKQGSQIRKPAVTNQKNSVPSPVTQPHQGNWQGPPRYPSSRGGRGGQRRPPPSRRSYPSQTQAPTKNSHAPKSRASHTK